MKDEFSLDPDWVTVRAGCTGAKMFLMLKAKVRKDVEIRNALRDKSIPPPAYGFAFEDNGQEFSVLLQRNQGSKWVQFRYEGDTLIAVDQSGKEVAKAT